MRGEMFIECKYDGERVQIHRDGNGAASLFPRLENITHQYPEIIYAFDKSDVPKNTILEGEIVAFDVSTDRLLPFQTLMQRRRKHEVPPTSRKITIALFAFDLLLFKNKNLLNRPLAEASQDCLRAASSHRASFACQSIS